MVFWYMSCFRVGEIQRIEKEIESVTAQTKDMDIYLVSFHRALNHLQDGEMSSKKFKSVFIRDVKIYHKSFAHRNLFISTLSAKIKSYFSYWKKNNFYTFSSIIVPRVFVKKLILLISFSAKRSTFTTWIPVSHYWKCSLHLLKTYTCFLSHSVAQKKFFLFISISVLV